MIDQMAAHCCKFLHVNFFVWTEESERELINYCLKNMSFSWWLSDKIL